MTYFQRIRSALGYPSMTQLSQSAEVMRRAKTTVRFYYLMLPFLAFIYNQTWTVPLTEQNFSPIWPLWWMQHFAVTPDSGIVIIRVFLLAATLLGTSFYDRRVVRILIFLAIWQAHAFSQSFSPDHQWYPWLFTSLILIFLPDGQRRNWSTSKDRDYLLIVWWAQASFMLLYTMSGFWKFEVAITQFLQGVPNGFSEYAFAYQVANWVPKLQNEALLAPFIIDYPLIAWPFYVASHFFQLFALWVMVRPSLQKLWASELILFHIGTFFAMGIDFWPFIPLLLVLFFNSPFSPEKTTVGMVIRDLPIIGWVVNSFWPLRTARVTG